MTADPLLVRFSSLLEDAALDGPVLDLACGTGENGLFVAGLGVPVILADRSAQALAVARSSAQVQGIEADFWEVDLETGANPLQEEHYRATLVFHYLFRPLILCIRKGVRAGGLLIYETFTSEQPTYGRPHNPDYLLQPGELAGWFEDWQLVHYFEGVLDDPRRALAQIVCRKPRQS
ncbi:MAG TPA: methyltransferase domain-containing protein [Chloroflexota bacterium]|nr:methyltransferase domain-containing protein [Chloroflexota bacterium]